jgi:hypothetical protein
MNIDVGHLMWINEAEGTGGGGNDILHGGETTVQKKAPGNPGAVGSNCEASGLPEPRSVYFFFLAGAFLAAFFAAFLVAFFIV